MIKLRLEIYRKHLLKKNKKTPRNNRKLIYAFKAM